MHDEYDHLRESADAAVAEQLEGAKALAHDLARLDPEQYTIVAEWMIEHGWSENLDPVVILERPIADRP